MHGRVKAIEKAKSDDERIATVKKIRAYNGLVETLVQKHVSCEYDDAGIMLSTKLLTLNPDFSTVWNYRKSTVMAELQRAVSVEEKTRIMERELLVTEEAIKRNSKSYCAWHHRRWIVEKGFAPVENELTLCAMFLKLDERNFHCWNYRRFVASLARCDIESELEFTRAKITENFSNYSAFHNRTKLLPSLHEGQGPTLEEIAAEFQLVQAAVFTEHDDQSAWLYHRWLVDYYRTLLLRVSVGARGEDERLSPTVIFELDSEFYDAIHGEISWIRELLGAEASSKWANITLVGLLVRLREVTLRLVSSTYPDAAEEANGYGLEAMGLLERLASEFDPLHANYYQAQLRSLQARFSVVHSPPLLGPGSDSDATE